MAAASGLVLVVDDDDAFRELVRTLLERAGFAVLEAVDAATALAAVDQKRPHVILLDVRLPDVCGYELYQELRDNHCDNVSIIFVSGEARDSAYRVAGLLLGADDFLLKPVDPDELIARVRRSLRTCEASAFEARAEGIIDDGPFAALTAREREILALLAGGRSTSEIALDLVISPRTVRTHIQHILAKVGVRTRSQAIALAHRGALPDVMLRSADEETVRKAGGKVYAFRDLHR